MPKIKPKVKDPQSRKTNFSSLFFLFATLLLVFFIYSFSLTRPWLPFDERSIYEEALFPIPQDRSEVKEIINAFVLNYHTESTNIFFSNHLTLRSNPIASLLLVLTSYLFQKNAFLYHLLQLGIHIVNVALAWLIMNELFKFQLKGSNTSLQSDNKKLFLTSLLTLIWGLHSANTEAILLVTNWTAILTYTFCLSFTLYEIKKITGNNFKVTSFKFITITVLFTCVMFLTEYGYMLPFVIFFLSFAFLITHTGFFKKAFIFAFKISLPYFLGILLFILLSLTRKESLLVNLNGSFSSLYLLIERNLWLSPQIFIHFLKLLFFPLKLTSYQSDLTVISPTLFDLHSVISILLYFGFIISPLLGIFLIRSHALKSICILFYAFFFSLVPFLHIVLPIYCLSADRYCYMPSFFLLLLIGYILSLTQPQGKKYLAYSLILAIVLVLLTGRTVIRITEWNNPYIFYKSAQEVEKNPLYKAHKQVVFASYLGKNNKNDEMNFYLDRSLRLLEEAINYYKTQVKKYPTQPKVLKQYGIDFKSLLLKAIYLKATTKHDNFKEDSEDLLSFYEPYIKKYLKLALTNQIAFYAELLVEANKKEKAKKILEYGLERFPNSASLLLSLSGYYIENQDLDNVLIYLKKAHEIFPNDLFVLEKFYKYHELKKDLPNQAKFAYLLGLRNHDPISYQNAAQIYLSLNKLEEAKLSIRKLIRLQGETPISILLTTRYLDLTGQRNNILPLLTKAYILSKVHGKNEDIKTTKSILASLITTNMFFGKPDDAKKYLKEFESIKNLSSEDRKVINELKLKL